MSLFSKIKMVSKYETVGILSRWTHDGEEFHKSRNTIYTCRKHAGYTDVKNASLVFVGYVTHCVICSAVLFPPSYVFYVHLSLSGLWRDVTWPKKHQSRTQRSTYVTMGTHEELKTLFVVLLLVAGNGSWPTSKAGSLQTDIMLRDCVSRKVTVDCRRDTWFGALVGPHWKGSFGRLVDGLSPLRRGFNLRGREPLG